MIRYPNPRLITKEKSMKKPLLVFAALLMTSSVGLMAKSYTYSLKNYDIPSRGCYPVSKVSLSEANKLIASQKLKTKGATSKEIRTLGAGLKWLQYLNKGPLKSGFPRVKGYEIRIKDGDGSSGQRGNHILIQRQGKKAHGLSVAQHVHEYAHLIGNNGVYAKYRTHMKGHGYCMVSNYADNNNNEQFAEVFTGFVTEPVTLLNNKRTPKACQRAFDFFLNWFDAGDRVYECVN
jgi:hypothetical protein